MEMNNMGFEFDWNAEIKNDSEFEVLPAGDYDFEVNGFERARHGGSDKLPPCNKAVLKIKVSSGNSATTITHNLFLHSSCEGRLCEFFTAIGARKHGQPLNMDWNRVVGARGRCKVIIDEFKSRNTGETLKNNKISRFYDPQKAAAAPAQTSAGSGYGIGGAQGFGGYTAAATTGGYTPGKF